MNLFLLPSVSKASLGHLPGLDLSIRRPCLRSVGEVCRNATKLLRLNKAHDHNITVDIPGRSPASSSHICKSATPPWPPFSWLVSSPSFSPLSIHFHSLLSWWRAEIPEIAFARKWMKNVTFWVAKKDTAKELKSWSDGPDTFTQLHDNKSFAKIPHTLLNCLADFFSQVSTVFSLNEISNAKVADMFLRNMNHECEGRDNRQCYPQAPHWDPPPLPPLRHLGSSSREWTAASDQQKQRLRETKMISQGIWGI